MTNNVVEILDLKSVNELYYSCSKNKGKPLFSHMQIAGFLMRQLIKTGPRLYTTEAAALL